MNFWVQLIELKRGLKSYFECTFSCEKGTAPNWFSVNVPSKTLVLLSFSFPFPLLSPTIVVRRPFWGARCLSDHLGRLGSQRSSGGIVKMESAQPYWLATKNVCLHPFLRLKGPTWLVCDKSKQVTASWAVQKEGEGCYWFMWYWRQREEVTKRHIQGSNGSSSEFGWMTSFLWCSSGFLLNCHMGKLDWLCLD